MTVRRPVGMARRAIPRDVTDPLFDRIDALCVDLMDLRWELEKLTDFGDEEPGRPLAAVVNGPWGKR